MSSETLIIVVGGDDLAFEICKEILRTPGHAVVLVWKHPGDPAETRLRHEAQALHANFGDAFTFLNEDPASPAMLRRAGLGPPDGEEPRSYCIVAVSQDDRLNLRVSLMARDINEHVRITLRQFNPVLGEKIQEALHYNCTVISPAAHAAATYAASAVDPTCEFGLRFPGYESKAASMEGSDLCAFSTRSAEQFGVSGMSVERAEREICLRIVSVNGRWPYLCAGAHARHDEQLLAQTLAADDVIVAFGPVETLRAAGAKAAPRRDGFWPSAFVRWLNGMTGLRRLEPVLRSAMLVAVLLFLAFALLFGALTHWNPWSAMYFALTTMEGSPDTVLCSDCGPQGKVAWWQIVEMGSVAVATLTGLIMTAIFTAAITSGLYASAVRRTQGLRRIYRSGHIIVCGAGNVGTLVIEYLRQLGERVVVVEKMPNSLLIEMARDRKIDLLTGDATNDETIAYCSPGTAKSLVGVTNSDTTNLEAALGARSQGQIQREGPLPVVLRIDDPAFGRSVRRHFGVASFSTTELTAPAIAGLARFESTRGRIHLSGEGNVKTECQLAERVQGPDNLAPPAPLERPGYQVRWIPLYVWRHAERGKGRAIPIRKFDNDVQSGDRLLFLVPLDQFGQPGRKDPNIVGGNRAG